jgi:hypothetical protein
MSKPWQHKGKQEYSGDRRESQPAAVVPSVDDEEFAIYTKDVVDPVTMFVAGF